MNRLTSLSRKKLLSAAVTLLLVTGIFGVVQAMDLASGTASNASPYSNEGASITPELGFSGTVVNLSLAQALEQAYDDSTALATAEANKVASQAKAEGYYAMHQDDMGDFADAQADRNYETERNALDRSVIKKYFEVLQARQAVTLSQENADAQELLFKNANLKFQQGLMSQNDVLKAQAAASQATADLQAAQNGYTVALMAFNQFLGYPIMQNTVLTDTLMMAEQPLIALGEGIARAKDHRNEIISAYYLRDYTGDVKNDREAAYDSSGTDYDKYLFMTAEAAWMSANRAGDDAAELMEIDVRSKYMAVIAAQSALEAAQLGVAKATEAQKIANLSLDQGLITNVDVQLAQTGVYQAQLTLLKAQLNDRLAVLDYEQSMGLGTTSVAIPAPVVVVR